MGPALFVIAIMGCGEGNGQCQQLRLAETRYETETACTAATPAVLARNTDLAFPLIVAECRRAGAGPRRLDASEVLMPAPPRFGAPARYVDARAPR